LEPLDTFFDDFIFYPLLFGCLFAIYGYVQPVNSEQIDPKLKFLEQSKIGTLLKPITIIPILVSIAVMRFAQYSSDYSVVDWWITVTGVLLCGELGSFFKLQKLTEKSES